MSDQERPRNEQEEQELREAAESVGADPSEDVGGEQLVQEAQEAGEDSASSPTQWKVDEDDATK